MVNQMRKITCDNCGNEIQGTPKQLRFVSECDYCERCHIVIQKYCMQKINKIKERVKEGFIIE